MLKIKALTFENIGRFTEPQTIVFDDLGRLVQVDGKNLNTGGSSGSGKTTVFNALDYLLGLNDIANTLLQARLTKSAMKVTGTFDWDGKELVITRSKKLSIEVGGTEIVGAAKITEEKLDEILGVSRDLFRSMLHKRQKEGGFFLKFTPKETYEFLTDALNLSELRKKADMAHAASVDLEKRLAQANTSVEASKSALMATNDAILTLGERPSAELDKEALTKLKEEADKAKYLYDNLIEGHKQASQEFLNQRPQPETGEYDDSAIADLEEKKKEAESRHLTAKMAAMRVESERREKLAHKKSEFARVEQQKKAQYEGYLRLKSEGEACKTKALRLAGEIKQLRANICFTCEQPWITDTAKKKELDLLAELNKCREIITLGGEAEISANLLSSEMTSDKVKSEAELKEMMVPTEVALATDHLVNAFDDQIKTEKAKKAAFFADIQKRNSAATQSFQAQHQALFEEQHRLASVMLEDANKKQRQLDLMLGSAQAQKAAADRYDKTSELLQAQQQAATEKLHGATVSLLDINHKFLMAEEAKRAIRGYTSRLFDNALATIGDNATRIIRQIPNMQNATIQLSATRETGDGKIKEEVNAVLHNDGEENVPLKTLSGGERTSADLAVDFAAVQFLRDQANKGIDLFILDEPFTGLDSANIEAIVEMLKQLSSETRIVVVDHNPVVAEQFESKIIVKREGSSSSLSA